MMFTPSEQTAILDSPLRDLPSLFPNRSLADVKRERYRLQNVRALRKYRQQRSRPDAVPECIVQKRWNEMATVGSTMLLQAIQNAGVRP